MFKQITDRIIKVGQGRKWLLPFALLALMVVFGCAALAKGVVRLRDWARDFSRRIVAALRELRRGNFRKWLLPLALLALLTVFGCVTLGKWFARLGAWLRKLSFRVVAALSELRRGDFRKRKKYRGAPLHGRVYSTRRPVHRLAAAALAVCMVFTLMPTTAFAATECDCTLLCTEAATNADCPVCGENPSLCKGEAATECDCTLLCTEAATNADCPVCGENLSLCKGEAATECDCTLLCTEAATNADCPVCCGENPSLCKGEAANASDIPTLLLNGNATPTVVGKNIYANGVPLLLVAAEADSTKTVVYIDANGNGEIDGGESIFDPDGEGEMNATDEGNDLSGHSFYGGSNNAILEGDTKITMTGGKVSKIYGGGATTTAKATANVTGTTYITTKGTAVVTSLCGGGHTNATGSNANVEAVNIVIAGNADVGNGGTVCGGGFAAGGGTANVNGEVSFSIKENASMYVVRCGGGGPNTANVGSANLTISDSVTANSIYGGGMANGASAKTNVNGKASVTISGSTTVSGSVYGGGYANNIAGNATVGNGSVTINGDAKVGGSVYGGGTGAGITTATTTSVTISGSTTVSGSVYGGGYAGSGSTDTVSTANITVSGTAKVTGSVYGGGTGIGTTTVTTPSVTIGGNATVGDGESKGVVINGGSGSVANGVDSFTISPDLNGADNYISVVLPAGYDVSGNPTIATGAAQDDLAKITLVGDDAAGKEAYFENNSIKVRTPTPDPAPSFDSSSKRIYANGVPLLLVAGKTDSTKTVVYIDTNENGEIDDNESIFDPDGEDTMKDTDEGNDLSGYSFYGGSKDKDLESNTQITMTGGKVSYIYGGGRADSGNANVIGDTTITMTGGEVARIYGGGYADIPNAHIVGKASVKVSGGKVTTIYGGGKFFSSGSAGIKDSPSVEISGTANVVELYGGGDAPDQRGDILTSVTIGGNATVGDGISKGVIINSLVDRVLNGVGYFTISSDLNGADESISVVLPAGYDVSDNPTIAKDAVAGDLPKIKLIGTGATGKEAYFDDNDKSIKVKAMPTPEVVGGNIYANGVPLLLAVGKSNSNNTVVYIDTNRNGSFDNNESIFDPDGNGTMKATDEGNDLSRYTIYGGSKDKNLESNTKITMTGGTVARIYGGGHADGDNADITGSTSIKVSGGKVEVVYGGGHAFSGNANVSGDTSVTVSGGEVTRIYGGGYADNGEYTATVNRSSVEISGTANVGSVYGGGTGLGTTTVTTPSVSIGGNATVGNGESKGVMINGGTGYSLVGNGVESFTISSALKGADESISVVLPAGYYIPSNPTIATGAVAADLSKIKLVGRGATDKEVYFEDKSIKMRTATPDPTVISVVVSPATVDVEKGTTYQFAATVSGENNPAQTVVWSIDGNHHSSTSINENGLLTVAADETVATLTVKATSTVDGTKSDTAVVTVKPKTYTLTVEYGTGSDNYAAGAEVQIEFNAPIDGMLFDKWTTNGGGAFENASSPKTVFTMPANAVTVTATYKVDTTVIDTAIAAANNAKTGITVNDSPVSSVANGVKFVTTQEMNTLDAAILAAEAAKSTVGNKGEATNAATTLNQAVEAFVKAIKIGTYTSGGGSSGGGGSSSSVVTPPENKSEGTGATETKVTATVDSSGSAKIDLSSEAIDAAIDKAIEAMKANGTGEGGVSVEITINTGAGSNGAGANGAGTNGAGANGTGTNGTGANGTGANGAGTNGAGANGAGTNGTGANGAGTNGAGANGTGTNGTGANSITVNLPKAAQEQLILNKVESFALIIDQPDIIIRLGLDTIRDIHSQAQADIQLSATEITDYSGLSAEARAAIADRPLFQMSATYQGGVISKFGEGYVSFEIPYERKANEQAGSLYLVYVDDNGKTHFITDSGYDEERGMLMGKTNHYSIYGVGYKAPSVTFSDIQSHWAKKDIEFAVSRGLLEGIGGNTFSPDTAMTRGMLVTALGRLSEVDITKYKTSSFTDVKANAYYAPYVAWAVEKGVLSGTGGTTFSPDDTITREQMAVIMVNYAKAIGYTLPKTREAVTFADNDSIGNKEADAVKAVQTAGIMNGKNGNRFDPQSAFTKAEAAALIHRYVELRINLQTAQGLDINDSGSVMMYENGKAVKSESRKSNGNTYAFNSYGEAALPVSDKKYLTHVVKKNEYFWAISRIYGCSQEDIMELNGLKLGDVIHPGDLLKVPAN